MTQQIFSDDNTSGFTADELRSMNAAYSDLLADYDLGEPNLDDIRKQLADDISDAISVTGAGGWGGAADIVAHVRGLRELRRSAAS